ncbi:MAG: signal peptidase I, partial [Bradymonadia bacterium]
MSQLAKLAAGTTIEVDAEGGSMFPLIRNGDSVLVRPIDRKLRVGDVVLLVLDGRWILHRIVELTAVTVRTQGDNQAQADHPVGL